MIVLTISLTPQEAESISKKMSRKRKRICDVSHVQHQDVWYIRAVIKAMHIYKLSQFGHISGRPTTNDMLLLLCEAAKQQDSDHQGC